MERNKEIEYAAEFDAKQRLDDKFGQDFHSTMKMMTTVKIAMKVTMVIKITMTTKAMMKRNDEQISRAPP